MVPVDPDSFTHIPWSTSPMWRTQPVNTVSVGSHHTSESSGTLTGVSGDLKDGRSTRSRDGTVGMSWRGQEWRIGRTRRVTSQPSVSMVDPSWVPRRRSDCGSEGGRCRGPLQPFSKCTPSVHLKIDKTTWI